MGSGGFDRSNTEISNLAYPALGHQQVGRFQITVKASQ
jgi:hypothetical protein